MRSLIFLLLFSSQAFGISIIGLGDLPGGQSGYSFASYSYNNGISDNGEVVIGVSQGVNTNGHEGFKWSSQTGMISLGTYPNPTINGTADVRAVSNDGNYVAGTTKYNGSNQVNVVRWTGNSPQIINMPTDFTASSVKGISGNGNSILITGQKNGLVSSNVWSGGVNTNILSPNNNHLLGNRISDDGSIVVGSLINSSNKSEAFIWNDLDGVQNLGYLNAQDSSSYVSAMSDDGLILAGSSGNGNDIQEAFIWTQGSGMVGIGDLLGGNDYSVVSDISSDGEVVIGRSDAGALSGEEGFLWTASLGMQSFEDFLISQGLDLSSWSDLSPTGISADKRFISGYGKSQNSENFSGYASQAFLVELDPNTFNPVPLPAAFWLFTSGLISLRLFKR